MTTDAMMGGVEDCTPVELAQLAGENGLGWEDAPTLDRVELADLVDVIPPVAAPHAPLLVAVQTNDDAGRHVPKSGLRAGPAAGTLSQCGRPRIRRAVA